MDLSVSRKKCNEIEVDKETLLKEHRSSICGTMGLYTHIHFMYTTFSMQRLLQFCSLVYKSCLIWQSPYSIQVWHHQCKFSKLLRISYAFLESRKTLQVSLLLFFFNMNRCHQYGLICPKNKLLQNIKPGEEIGHSSGGSLLTQSPGYYSVKPYFSIKMC